MTDDFCSLLQPQAFQGLQVERPAKKFIVLVFKGGNDIKSKC